MSSFSFKSFFKVIISLILVYHLFMILILPHFRFTHHQKWMHYFQFYQFIASFNNRWDRYSIQLLPKFYIKYEILEKSKKAKSKTLLWPPSHKEYMIFNHKRLVSGTMYLINKGPVSVRKYLLPWLCRKHTNAQFIKAQAIVINKKTKPKSRFFKSSSHNSKRNKKDHVLFSTTKRCANPNRVKTKRSK